MGKKENRYYFPDINLLINECFNQCLLLVSSKTLAFKEFSWAHAGSKMDQNTIRGLHRACFQQEPLPRMMRLEEKARMMQKVVVGGNEQCFCWCPLSWICLVGGDGSRMWYERPQLWSMK